MGWAGKAAARHMTHPRQRPGHKRGRREECGKCWCIHRVRARAHPIPLSAGNVSLLGQAHAKHAHQWILPERDTCPIREPPDPGLQTLHRLGVPREGDIDACAKRAGHPPNNHQGRVLSPPHVSFKTTLTVVLGGRGLRMMRGVLTLKPQWGGWL